MPRVAQTRFIAISKCPSLQTMSAQSPAPGATPITAISSSLSKRPSQSLPPASQIYEPHVKSVLARRLVRRVFTTSAITSWVLASVWTAWMKGGVETIGLLGWIANWFSLSSLLCASLLWLLASVPIAVLRKTYLSGMSMTTIARLSSILMLLIATRSTSLSPFQTFTQNRSQVRYQQALLILLASSSSIVFTHSFFSYFVETPARGDAKLGIWAGSKSVDMQMLLQYANNLFFHQETPLPYQWPVHLHITQSYERCTLLLGTRCP